MLLRIEKLLKRYYVYGNLLSATCKVRLGKSYEGVRSLVRRKKALCELHLHYVSAYAPGLVTVEYGIYHSRGSLLVASGSCRNGVGKECFALLLAVGKRTVHYAVCRRSLEGAAARTEYTASEIVDKAERYREYFARTGGITVSGGEPLAQAKFVFELFSLCKERGIHTCLDTSGYLLNDDVKELLTVTDRVLLDIKYTSEESYRNLVGCSLHTPLAFLAYLQQINLPTTIRQVIIPTHNDTPENIAALREIVRAHSCVDTTELLPFRKICQTKYDALGIPFPMADIPEPTRAEMQILNNLLQN